MQPFLFKFKEQLKNNNQEITSITQLVNKLARVSRARKYKFTGKRAMARQARGSSYILNSPSYYRLTVVKVRVVKGQPWQTVENKTIAIKKHLRYLTRDNAKAFNQDQEDINITAFAKDLAQDRHHFRFIISPEDATKVDLKKHAKSLVKQMEQDLGVTLTWLGVIHYDTDNWHIHLVIKGNYQQKDLIIKPDYISRGLRSRSSYLLTLELGPRTELSIINSKTKALQQNRVVAIDYKIEQLAKAHDFKFTPWMFQGEEVKLATIRIKHLQKLNLVAEHKTMLGKFYQVNDNLIVKLKELELNHDIYKKLAKTNAQILKYDNKQSIIGKVIVKGLQNELIGSYYAIIDGVDGNKWYIDTHNNIANIKLGQIIYLDHTKNKLYFASNKPLEEMVQAPTFTILDRLLSNQELQKSLEKTPLGMEIKKALDDRREILIKKGLVKIINQEIIFNSKLSASPISLAKKIKMH